MFRFSLIYLLIIILIIPFLSGCFCSKKIDDPMMPQKEVRKKQQKVHPPEKGEIFPVFFIEQTKVISLNSRFTTEININSGDQKVAAYDFSITYPEQLLELDLKKGNHGVQSGKDGFVTMVNQTGAGILKIVGFDIFGKGPKSNLNLLRINWLALKKGEAQIILKINTLVNPQTTQLPTTVNNMITINIQ